MKTTTGNQLHTDDQRYVLSAFVHRFTAQHRPNWANKTIPNRPNYPAVQFASDAEWLANTRFAVRNNGRLDKRAHYCESSPTWPNNPELRNKAA